jgi:hypothetical protein
MANKHRKVWKVVSRKVNSGKQTWPSYVWECTIFISVFLFYKCIKIIFIYF